MFLEVISKYLGRLNEHILSVEELKDITYTLVENFELKDYFSGIEFNIPNNTDLGTYNFITKKMRLHRKHLIWMAEDDYKRSKLTSNRITFINLSILEALFHEMVHAMQNYIAFDANWTLSPLLKMDIVSFYNHTVSDEDYDAYHNAFPYERDANATAIEYILYIIQNYVHDDELYEYFKNRLHGFMIEHYQKDGDNITSPIEFVYTDIYGLAVPCVHNMDLYDRIKLGFNVSAEEYDQYIRNKNEMILAKNNLNYK